MKVWAFATSRVSILDTGSPILVSPRWAPAVGVGGQPAVWAITAVITVFLVTLQANAMWKRLIHGSQVLNTATPPATAVIPTPPPRFSDPQQLPSLFPPQTLLSGGKEEGCRRKGGSCDYLRVKDRMWATKGYFFESSSFQTRVQAQATEGKIQSVKQHFRYNGIKVISLYLLSSNLFSYFYPQKKKKILMSSEQIWEMTGQGGLTSTYFKVHYLPSWMTGAWPGQWIQGRTLWRWNLCFHSFYFPSKIYKYWFA